MSWKETFLRRLVLEGQECKRQMSIIRLGLFLFRADSKPATPIFTPSFRLSFKSLVADVDDFIFIFWRKNLLFVLVFLFLLSFWILQNKQLHQQRQQQRQRQQRQRQQEQKYVRQGTCLATLDLFRVVLIWMIWDVWPALITPETSCRPYLQLVIGQIPENS